MISALTDADKAARRLLIANVVAMYSGTIHGAKDVVAHVVESLPDVLFNDPLSAPYYDVVEGFTVQRRAVEWKDQSLSSGAYPGAGDLFLSEILKPSAVPDVFAEQRHRVLGCTAGSLREVYGALPQWSGELAAAEPDILENPYDDACWTHWATNESMAAAHDISFQSDLGPLNLFLQNTLGSRTCTVDGRCRPSPPAVTSLE